jgi:transposase
LANEQINPISGSDIESVNDLETAKQMLRAQAALIAALLQQVAELKVELEDVKRRGKRQAAPFSKGAPKAAPKPPGQKPGHPASHRDKPSKVDITLEAPLPQCCPDCGGRLIEDSVEVQYQVDIPRPIPVSVTQFNVHVGYCQDCQMRVQGRHAQQTSDALGAAGVQIGPNAIGLGMTMKHGLGVSYGKAARTLSVISDLTIHRSTLVRADQRVAEKLTPTYHQLMLRLRKSEVVHADETGWKINGTSAWLWVFANDDLSVYVIDPSRAHEVVEDVLGQDFKGVLNCDCFLAYDPLPYKQNKCMAHLLRRCKDITEIKSGRAVKFSQQVAQLVRAAITLKSRRTHMSAHGYTVACGRIQTALDRLLDSNYTDPDNARLAKLLRKQRQRLFTFLYVDVVQPTNNHAEREIRPAVIIRKTNGCNRSRVGARTHSIVTSVLRTCQKQGRDFIDFVASLLRHPDAIAPPIFGIPLPATGASITMR